MEEWEQALDKLLNSNSTGVYHYCSVNQIVLEDLKTGIAWNYFTHIHFSQKYAESKESTFLRSPVSIGDKFRVYFLQYAMNKSQFKECVRDAIISGVWNYTDSKKRDAEKIDGAFVSLPKYVPENDPTGSTYKNVVPMEKSIYGSNFCGNYYIFEIYGRCDNLNHLLTSNDKNDIQKEITKCGLTYHLDSLNDRVGNIICRFDIESLIATPIKLGQNGTVHHYTLAESVRSEARLHFHIEQEHDRMVYEYTDWDIVLKDGESLVGGVGPNQCKTTITITDSETNLILFRIVSDQSVYSNYRGQISLGNIFSIASSHLRIIKIDGQNKSIQLSGVSRFGEIFYLTEMSEAVTRQQTWEDEFYKEQKYLNVYYGEEHERAISDIREIMNRGLLWDLQEVCIIDPYLSPNDILDTVIFCKKEGIHVRCLTSLHTISKNKEARSEILPEDIDSNEFDKIKATFRKQLEDAIGLGCDLCLSYRTIHDSNGTKFHDRYLILKYQINKTRVWSLGTSINSVGKSHHIIQIVESPTLIEEFFDQVWDETATDVCKIYDYADYLTDDSEKDTHPDITIIPMVDEEALKEGKRTDSDRNKQEQTTLEEQALL